MFPFTTLHKFDQLLKIFVFHATYQAHHFIEINFLSKLAQLRQVKVLQYSHG
jgi:hypothetical protein